MLFNQFHDILPGSSTAEVFVDANQAWMEAEQTGEQLLAKALERSPAKFNSLPHRSLTANPSLSLIHSTGRDQKWLQFPSLMPI